MCLDSNSKHLAFSKSVETLFILDTPFQLMCAYEFINNFNVNNPLVLLAFDPNEKRNDQVLNMVKELRLKYVIFLINDYWSFVKSFFDKKLIPDVPPLNKYNRIFIGNYFSLDQWALATYYAKNKTTVLFSDDGSSSIALLQGYRYDNVELHNKFYDIWRKNSIDFGPYIYTMYADLNTSKFITYQNDFRFLSRNNKNEDNAIYIIGTNSSAYCSSCGFDKHVYEAILWIKLSEVRSQYPNNKIFYIPHGRDNDEYTKSFCELLNIIFLPLSVSVEYYFVFDKNCSNAISIYGFGSTALLTLKLLRPNADVINWFVDIRTDNYKNYRLIKIYYEKHGIRSDVISFPNVPFYKIFKRRLKNLIGIK